MFFSLNLQIYLPISKVSKEEEHNAELADHLPEGQAVKMVRIHRRHHHLIVRRDGHHNSHVLTIQVQCRWVRVVPVEIDRGGVQVVELVLFNWVVEFAMALPFELTGAADVGDAEVGGFPIVLDQPGGLVGQVVRGATDPDGGL